jgi:hypothetical protein
MKLFRKAAFFSSMFAILVAIGCGAKPPSEPVNPLGGSVNTGGKPDVNKSKGTVDTGGDVNTGGKPDVSKSHGTIGPGGDVNTGGKPDVSKSVPGKDGGK